MNNDPLISLLENWRSWDNDRFSFEPVSGNEYLVYTSSVNGLGNGINFYINLQDDNTFSLSDRVLTAKCISQEIIDFNQIKLPSARLAADYGVLLNERGEFVDQDIKAEQLSEALNRFTELLLREVDLAKTF